MAVSHLLLVVGTALALAFFSGSVTEAGEVGVCYGMMARNLIKPPAVVQLLKNNGIKVVTLYDANAEALGALAGTGIKVGVSLPNDNLAAAAVSKSYALDWVQKSVQAYPNTQINSVAVGNEVFHQRPELTSQLLPAMKNIQEALANVGMADTVKVITPIALDALEESFPPSAGVFRADLAQSVMKPMIDFLAQTGSYLSFNIYPYFAYKMNPKIDLNYVLFLPNSGQSDPKTGLHYDNMFDAMVDAVFHAVEKLSSSPAHTRGRKLDSITDYLTQSMRAKETGYSSGMYGPASSTTEASGLVGEQADATSDAQTYNNNLISKILRGGGTPYKPNADLSANIFSLFNEDLKPGNDAERNFGLFYPDGTPVYKVDFTGGGTQTKDSWCKANAAVGDKRLQAALDYACGHGADCSAIQPGRACYQPNTVVAHASYAFNSYYQSKGRVSGSCDFSGAASLVYQQPAGCDPNANGASWCVANAAVGDKRLQAALDYACGHGADCSAIQAGGRCFNPNTKVAHASYAFNDYYKKNGRSDQSCDFGGCGSVVHKQPTFGNCVL